MEVEKSYIINPFQLESPANNILVRQHQFPLSYNVNDGMLSISTKDVVYQSLKLSHPDLQLQFIDSYIKNLKIEKLEEIVLDLAKLKGITYITGFRIRRFTEDDGMTPYYIWELFVNNSKTELFSSSMDHGIAPNSEIEKN